MEAGSRIGRLWRTLAEGEKGRYQERAKTINAGNQAEQASFKQSLTPNQTMALHVLRLNNKYRRHGISARTLEDDVREFLHQLPETPYTTGREVFMGQAMKGKSGSVGETRERMKTVMEQWNRLNPAEQAQYEKQAEQSVQQFRAQLAALLKK